MFGKSILTYSCACRTKVAVSVESKLQIQNRRSCWNLKVFDGVPRLESSYVSNYKLQHCILWKASFGQVFTVQGENFAEHIFVKSSQHINFSDDQNGIWQALKTSILNTTWAPSSNSSLTPSLPTRLIAQLSSSGQLLFNSRIKILGWPIPPCFLSNWPSIFQFKIPLRYTTKAKRVDFRKHWPFLSWKDYNSICFAKFIE